MPGCPRYVRTGWCWSCWEALKFGFQSCVAQKNYGALRRRKRRDREMFVRRNQAAAAAQSAGGVNGSGLAERYPAVWEYLSVSQYEDGTARRTSTLMLFVDASGVKVCLNDRDADLTCWITASSPGEALEALETALQAGRAEWQKPVKKKR